MGVFDFIKEAGAKVGLGDGGSDKAEADADAAKRAADQKERMVEARKRKDADATAAASKRSAAKRAELKERHTEATKSSELEKYVKDLGLDAEDLEIRFNDGTATIEGSVATQEDREKIILAVGNVEGVAKVDEEIDVVDESAQAKMYTVVKGDSLSKIAKEYYGDGSKYPAIFEANKPMLKNPDLIYPGQVLRIPAL